MKNKTNIFVSLFAILIFCWVVTGVQATNQPSPTQNENINGTWHDVETWNLALKVPPPPAPLFTTVLEIALKILDQLPKIKTLYDQIMPPENRFPSPEVTLDLFFAMVVIPLAVVVTLSYELRLRSLKSVKIQASLKRLGLLKEERGIKEKRALLKRFSSAHA